MGKYKDNWKHGKFKNCEIGNIENVEKDNRNKNKKNFIRTTTTTVFLGKVRQQGVSEKM